MPDTPRNQAHREVILALPWYVNGTLDADERAEVEAHLAESAELRAELARERRLAAAIYASELADFSMDQDFAELEGQLTRRQRWPEQFELALLSLLSPAVAMPLAAASLVVVIAVGTLQSPTGQTFETLTDAGQSAPQLKVLLAPGHNGAALRRLAKTHGLGAVTGPSATGVFTIAVDNGGDLDMLAAAFDAHPAVDFVDVTR